VRSRPHLCLLAAAVVPLTAAAESPTIERLDPAFAARDAAGEWLWYDAPTLTVEGRGWSDTDRFFDRLPGRARGAVPDAVWTLSRHAAGLALRFSTDSDRIAARWTLTGSDLAMPHMPATGVSGLDLYVLADGRWRSLGHGRPSGTTTQAVLAQGIPAAADAGEHRLRDYLLYLPLYNGVESLEIGVAPDAALAPAAPRPAGRRRPLVFYGTSITHGACASRPGMAHVAILGRRLDRPVANLGFSGSGRMDAAVGDLLARVDAACIVIDCLPNMDAEQVRERCAPLVKRLRAVRPEVPIVLVEDRRLTNAWILPAKDRLHDGRHAALREAYEALVAEGVTGLHYLSGDDLLGADSEGTVDASHPTDLGFMRQADAFEPVLRKALQADMPRATSGAK